MTTRVLGIINGEAAAAAYEAWGCNCGPAAIAAIMNMRLDDVRWHIPDFDTKRYTSPAMMNAALRSIGRRWEKIGARWPDFGLARIQWEGPWIGPGVPIAARYRYTHWVASCIQPSGHGIFDVNATGNNTGWASYADWERVIVPHIVSGIARANGAWHITHGIEVD